jgi:polyhydroxyalkanoate synthase
MSDQHKPIAAHANLPDPAAAQRALASIFVNAVKATRAAHQALAQPEPLPFDPADQVRALLSFGFTLFSQPMLLGEAQLRAWNEWLALWNSTLQRTAGGVANPVFAPARGDRRFSDPAWTEELWFDHLKQAYLLVGRQLSRLVDSVGGIEDDTRLRVGFMVRQYLDALAPTNFAATNPEVIRKAMETGGVNLLAGLANMLADAAGNRGLVKRRSAEAWELGVSIAATPGSVVFQNELLQLIQYNPATEQVARRPLLYVPPLVNKYYLLDLQPKSSLLKWLVDQGRTVFAISWVNPGPELRDKDLSSYVIGGVVAAMDAVRDATGEPDVDLAAFCMG